jgi:hypothetical protein
MLPNHEPPPLLWPKQLWSQQHTSSLWYVYISTGRGGLGVLKQSEVGGWAGSDRCKLVTWCLWLLLSGVGPGLCMCVCLQLVQDWGLCQSSGPARLTRGHAAP